MGILNTMMFKSDSVGTQAMFAVESNSRMNFFTRLSKGIDTEALQDNFFDEEI